MQNTGGFFVAAIIKKSLLPWEKIPKPIPIQVIVEETPLAKETVPENPSRPQQNLEETSSETVSENASKQQQNSAPSEPQRKRRRLHGYKEDPYVFFTKNEEIWEQIKSFYDLSNEFNPLCLLTRSFVGKKKNIYFCSPAVRDLLLCNESSIKIINTGVKTFVRCDNRNMKCAFR